MKRKNISKKDDSVDLKSIAKEGFVKKGKIFVANDFVHTGNSLLNLALTSNINNGYPVGRVVNIVGDYSSGKTLMACELVNQVWFNEHINKGKKVKIIYDEPEAAFDLELAQEFNMPLSHIYGLREMVIKRAIEQNDKKTLMDMIKELKIDKKDINTIKQAETAIFKKHSVFTSSQTIEEFYYNVQNVLKKSKNEENDIIVYILDSLDSISDQRELNKIEKDGIEKQDYQGRKGLVMSQLFRTLVRDMSDSKLLLFIVSQLRHNIGAMGPAQKKMKRSGGKALDFYCTQIIWLHEIGQLKTRADGLTTGVNVKAIIDKNKVGSRYRSVFFEILHGYGIDDIGSIVNWLRSNKILDIKGPRIIWEDKTYFKNQFVQFVEQNPGVLKELKKMTQRKWRELEQEAVINRKPKYGV